MCGRYVIEDFQELSERLTNIDINFLIPLHPTWNAAPSQTLPVLVEAEDEESWLVKGMTWGLIPKWTKPGEKPKVAPINARAETIAEKPMFRSLVKQRRCVVPANGFYEWKRAEHGKQPYYIHMKNDSMMFFAGLYDEAKRTDGSPLESYAIITTSSNDTMADLHDRMPVILSPEDVEHWLSRSETDVNALEPLLHAAPDDAIEIYPVSRDANNTRNNEPELIEPLAEQPPLLIEEDETS